MICVPISLNLLSPPRQKAVVWDWPWLLKMIGDHGGLIECESEPKKTIFRIMLPMYSEKQYGVLKTNKEKAS